MVHTLVGFMAISMFACHKYTSIENGGALPVDMVATIDSLSWEAAEGTMSAVVAQGFVTISGISADGQEISITLNDTVVGMYALNQTSASLAIYANLDSVGSYAYSTNQGTDTSQAGGTVNVTLPAGSLDQYRWAVHRTDRGSPSGRDKEPGFFDFSMVFRTFASQLSKITP